MCGTKLCLQFVIATRSQVPTKKNEPLCIKGALFSIIPADREVIFEPNVDDKTFIRAPVDQFGLRHFNH